MDIIVVSPQRQTGGPLGTESLSLQLMGLALVIPRAVSGQQGLCFMVFRPVHPL
jgi:hypothetical protein